MENFYIQYKNDIKTLIETIEEEIRDIKLKIGFDS
jgi:hypothetical protein